jgi:hypothetical protein
LISFLRYLKYLSYISFTCFVRVTSCYVVLFVTILKGVISLMHFSVCLSFEYKKATDLFEIILYPTTLLKLFINFRSSLFHGLRWVWGDPLKGSFYLKEFKTHRLRTTDLDEWIRIHLKNCNQIYEGVESKCLPHSLLLSSWLCLTFF